ncbi:MAG: GapA-binding peptide SR1P [Bacillaceae bacterium]|nr:GapA-binding peptide SR1P [Bacillaceae bacterium]
MGTIVCQDCQRVIDHFDAHKVTVLYGKGCTCNKDKENKRKS